MYFAAKVHSKGRICKWKWFFLLQQGIICG